MRRIWVLWVVLLGCASQEPGPTEVTDEDVDPAFFNGEGDLLKIDARTVDELARSWACSTGYTRALDLQIAHEMACMAPGSFLPVDDIPGLQLGPGARPFLQADAAKALRRAVAISGRTLTLNSGWRSLAQQYLMKRWEGSCGIRLAAAVGKSQHESGLAVDFSEYDDVTVRKALSKTGFLWYCDRTNGGYLRGCADPVHFDQRTGDDLRSVSVLAFQKLWNRNHPEDRIDEDGSFGPQTRRRLDRAPLAGFAQEAACDATGAPPADPPAADPPSTQACGTFADVPADHPAWPAIEAVHAKGWFDGCAEGPARFCPDDPITRGLLATVLAEALGLSLPSPQGAFADVPPDAWYASAIEALYARGIVQGCDDSNFCPEARVSRAELAVLVARMMGLSELPPSGRFGDVPADHWAAGAIEALYEAGVVVGCAADRYCPDDFAPRAQVALMLARAFRLPEPDRCR